MKTRPYIFTIILCTTIFQTVSAQKFTSYLLHLPPYLLSNVETVYVEDFESTSDHYANLGDDLAQSISQTIELEYDGVSSELQNNIFNPWITSKLYTVTDNKEEADAIISGSYSLTGTSSKEDHIVEKQEPSGFAEQLPYSYQVFSEKNTANFTANIQVYKREVDSVVFNINYEIADVAENQKAYEAPNVASQAALSERLFDKGEYQIPYYFCPFYEKVEYDFERVRPSRDLKDKAKEAKDLVKDGKIREAGKIFLEIWEKESDKDAALNTAMAYEIIGNYTKAKEFYQHAGNSAGLERIEKAIKNRDLLIEIGMTIEEPDL